MMEPEMNNIRPKNRSERVNPKIYNIIIQSSYLLNNQIEDYNFVQKIREKNRFTTESNINNPEPNSDFYISETNRLLGDNFSTEEYYRRKAEIEKRKNKYKFRQNNFLERERKRWERLDYDYLKTENRNMMNNERNLVGRKNNPGMAFNPLNLQYDNSVQGEILKKRDEESKYRSWLRSMNIDKHSNSGFNIINGEDRTILERKLNKDILPDIIERNMDEINDIKNKIYVKNDGLYSFYTKCPGNLKGYRYDDYNNNKNYYGNRINKSANTPRIINNNGGRFRMDIGNNVKNNFNLFNNNKIEEYNNKNNNFSPTPNMNVYNRNNYNNNIKYQDEPIKINNNDLECNKMGNIINYSNNNLDNNNTLNNNNFNSNNNFNNNKNFNKNDIKPQVPQMMENNIQNDVNNNTIGLNNDNKIVSPPGNELYNKSNEQQIIFEPQIPVQSNYNVNPYNPYSRPDFYFMNK